MNSQTPIFYVAGAYVPNSTPHAISNGRIAYWCMVQLFSYRPPDISYENIDDLVGANYDKRRVYKGSHSEFLKFCRTNHWEVHKLENYSELSFFKVLGRTLGPNSRPWYSHNAEICFPNAATAHKRWIDFDKELKNMCEDWVKYKRKVWDAYHRLINPSGIDTLSGIDFEIAVAAFYKKDGFKVELTSSSGDYGVDIIAEKGDEKIAIQTKRYTSKVGVKAVQEVSSGAFFYKANKAVVITNSVYTAPAINMARKTGVTLINGSEFRKLLGENRPTNIPPFDEVKYKKMLTEMVATLIKAKGKKNWW